MKHFVIGTAGHVDHGKTMLIKALTGKETDRLKEEKERGISIELGFAPFILPSGITAGVVDVPGHERFIKNMLAGVGGMDMVLLVVAADEGIMPQTREHLDIIDLLQVPEGIIVITKADLVEEEWLTMVQEDVSHLVADTIMENAPVVTVSAATGQGIPELIQLIDGVAGRLQERPVTGQARIPVDRVFSMIGFGTVITGTLVEGRLQVGDSVEILPEGIEARVRGLQVHGRKMETAAAGQRVAVNLAGIERQSINRGSVLAAPGFLKPSHRLDIRVKLLPEAEKSLVNRARIRVHIGAAEILARIILLESDELDPGENGFAQLECEQPVVAARGDRLVIRSYSPMRTIGGGIVVDPRPPKRRRLNPGVIETLRTKEKGTPEELLEQLMESSKQTVYTREELGRGLGFDEDATAETIKNLEATGRVRSFICDNKPHYILNIILDRKAAELKDILEKFHRKFPLRAGVSKEEIRSRVFAGLSNKVFNALADLYQENNVITIVDENIAKQGFEPGPGEDWRQMFQKIEERYLAEGLQNPGWEEITSEFKLNRADSEEVLNYFVNNRILIKLEDNILVHRKSLEMAKDLIIQFLEKNSEMSLGEARDILKTSRKFALPIMSFFDKEKVTRRVEDKRVLY
ncbi:MAG: selenocysteine-specific translation elongation factor [Firmicutes bacterium HGW-Firmicutes-8]|nr:MAG: selenocysteine-specific translation elongation factor [Firmicutes bacterium HGW-Firmicutes-8]